MGRSQQAAFLSQFAAPGQGLVPVRRCRQRGQVVARPQDTYERALRIRVWGRVGGFQHPI